MWTSGPLQPNVTLKLCASSRRCALVQRTRTAPRQEHDFENVHLAFARCTCLTQHEDFTHTACTFLHNPKENTMTKVSISPKRGSIMELPVERKMHYKRCVRGGSGVPSVGWPLGSVFVGGLRPCGGSPTMLGQGHPPSSFHPQGDLIGYL